MDKGFFAGVETKEYVSSTGERVELPIRYLDFAAMIGAFTAPADKLQGLLPSTRLKPALFTPGRGVIAFSAFEYRELVDLPPYNEFGISIPVLYEPRVNIPGLPLLAPQWFKTYGLYVHHLPVTTELARDGGIEIWGFPKFLAEITFEGTGDSLRCRLRADGKDIITLEGEKLVTRPRSMDWPTYTVKDDELLKTRTHVQGEMGISMLRGGATYALGDHPIADELRSLDMGDKAVQFIYAPQLQSLLYPGETRLPR
ncbi:MAG TPA: acetoacetate decarboxylase family protein [Anaerolineae bacterium]|nr:acetoacetate decarboxylase family protein [Anaerolineae bacterium]